MPDVVPDGGHRATSQRVQACIIEVRMGRRIVRYLPTTGRVLM